MFITLRPGQRSPSVRHLQDRLNQHGAMLVVDGNYGSITESAVKAYQLCNDLLSDGIAGGQTLAAMFRKNCEHEQQNALLADAAGRLDVPLASLYAVCEVESNGKAFLENGEPVILFERHVMYRQLMRNKQGEHDSRLRDRADGLALLHPTLISQKPGGYLGGTNEHERLRKARLIDNDAALQSASWGAFQIMGFHWHRLGYPSVQQLVEDMSMDYTRQLGAFVRFVETDTELSETLRTRDWKRFARLYNGPNYQQNQYDVKLQRLFEQHVLCGCGERSYYAGYPIGSGADHQTDSTTPNNDQHKRTRINQVQAPIHSTIQCIDNGHS